VTMPTDMNGSPVDMNQADQTYSVTSYGPSSVVALNLPLVALSDNEASLVTRLTALVESKRFGLQLLDAHYRGTVRVQDLGISIPPQMRNVKIAPGFPRVCVDALDRRLNVDGFRYPDSNDVDNDLQEIWLGNDLDAEHPLAHLDALVFGCGYVGVGSPATGGNVIDTPPLITVESPLDIAVEWDARTRTIVAALRRFGFEGSRQATLYLPDETISLVDAAGGWTVTDRDRHKMGQPMIVRIPNRPRSYARNGASEITPEIMNITDAASRAMLGLIVAGEFYSAPQRYILGADESAFQAPDGTPKSGWETYIGRVLALENDAEGKAPTVGQFTAYDPSVFTKVLDSYCQRISALTGLPPYMLGFATANPTSADAIRSGEGELTRRADHKTVMFGKGWRDVMKLALMIRGSEPANMEKITTVWSSTSTPTIAATTDAIFKQVTMGYLPATSDVTGEALGYNAIQRERIEIDRAADQGAALLEQIAHSLEAKSLRTETMVATDQKKMTEPAPAVTPAASPNMMPKKMPGSGNSNG
jgi:Phage portal protein, SPP1 Gp6-like